MDVKELLGLKRFDVLGFAEIFLKKEVDVSMTGYEWYSGDRDGSK